MTNPNCLHCCLVQALTRFDRMRRDGALPLEEVMYALTQILAEVITSVPDPQARAAFEAQTIALLTGWTDDCEARLH
jgi:hypothetical protein